VSNSKTSRGSFTSKLIVSDCRELPANYKLEIKITAVKKKPKDARLFIYIDRICSQQL